MVFRESHLSKFFAAPLVPACRLVCGVLVEAFEGSAFFSSKFHLIKISQTLVLEDCDALIIEANEFNSSDY